MTKVDYATHEALHMSWFLMESVERGLVEHDAVKNNPEWAELAKTAHQTLLDLYQAIGATHLSKQSAVFDSDG